MKKIKIIKDSFDAETRQARHDWAKLTGEKYELAPTQLLHIQSGEAYIFITGAIGYPTGDHHGCIMIAGIKAGGKIDILEYQEFRSIYQLIEAAIEERILYRFGEHRNILPVWTADPERFRTIISAVSVALEEKLGHLFGLYIRPPVDWYEPHAFPMFMWQLRDSLANGQMKLGKHKELISRIQSVQPDIIDKTKAQDLPSAGMLGALAHTVVFEKPWQQDIGDNNKALNISI